MASIVCILYFCLMSAAERAMSLSTGIIKLLSRTRLTLLVGSLSSLKYLDLISVRQIAGV